MVALWVTSLSVAGLAQDNPVMSRLYFEGKIQPAGTYSAANTPRFIKGKGELRNYPAMLGLLPFNKPNETIATTVAVAGCYQRQV